MINLTPGDRFKNRYSGSIWEYTHTDQDHNDWGECVDGFYFGNKAILEFQQIDWIYLGNFSKGNNFQSLYEKLSS